MNDGVAWVIFHCELLGNLVNIFKTLIIFGNLKKYFQIQQNF